MDMSPQAILGLPEKDGGEVHQVDSGAEVEELKSGKAGDTHELHH